MIAVLTILALLLSSKPLLDIGSLFGFTASMVAFLFIMVVVLIFIYIYDNLRRGKKAATTAS